jgi:hypothetical protein
VVKLKNGKNLQENIIDPIAILHFRRMTEEKQKFSTEITIFLTGYDHGKSWISIGCFIG